MEDKTSLVLQKKYFKMKRRQLEGQSSITSFFGAPAAKRQQTGDTQSDPAAQHQATPPLEEESEVAVEPVAAVTSAACADLAVPYFSNIRECRKGFTDGGMPIRVWRIMPAEFSAENAYFKEAA